MTQRNQVAGMETLKTKPLRMPKHCGVNKSHPFYKALLKDFQVAKLFFQSTIYFMLVKFSNFLHILLYTTFLDLSCKNSLVNICDVCNKFTTKPWGAIKQNLPLTCQLTIDHLLL